MRHLDDDSFYVLLLLLLFLFVYSRSKRGFVPLSIAIFVRIFSVGRVVTCIYNYIDFMVNTFANANEQWKERRPENSFIFSSFLFRSFII